MLDSQNQIAKDTISMKKTNEYFLPNARIADYTIAQGEIKLDKNISMEDLVKLFPFTEDSIVTGKQTTMMN